MSKNMERSPPSDALAALAALRRARLQAERLALMTGTYLVQFVDGKVVHVAPRLEVLPKLREAPDPTK